MGERGSCTLYLDTCADSGWPKPFGKSKTDWYVVSGLVLTPENDYKARVETERLLQKYIGENQRRQFPSQYYEIHYHDIIYGKSMFQNLSDIQRKNLSDEIFSSIKALRPVLFATVINKIQLKRIYSENAYQPRNLGLRATIHRYAMYVDREHQIGSIVVDEEEYRKDKELQAMIQDFRRDGITIRGYDYQPTLENKLKNVLNAIAFTPSHLSAGLQLADVCSRVTWSHFERRKSDRFKQLSSLWDGKSGKTYEPSVFPKPTKWI